MSLCELHLRTGLRHEKGKAEGALLLEAAGACETRRAEHGDLSGRPSFPSEGHVCMPAKQKVTAEWESRSPDLTLTKRTLYQLT